MFTKLGGVINGGRHVYMNGDGMYLMWDPTLRNWRCQDIYTHAVGARRFLELEETSVLNAIAGAQLSDTVSEMLCPEEAAVVWRILEPPSYTTYALNSGIAGRCLPIGKTQPLSAPQPRRSPCGFTPHCFPSDRISCRRHSDTFITRARSAVHCYTEPGLLPGTYCAEVPREVGPLNAVGRANFSGVILPEGGVTIISTDCIPFDSAITNGARVTDLNHTAGGGEILRVHAMRVGGRLLLRIGVSTDHSHAGETVRMRSQPPRRIGCGSVEGVVGVTMNLVFTAATSGSHTLWTCNFSNPLDAGVTTGAPDSGPGDHATHNIDACSTGEAVRVDVSFGRKTP